MSLKAVSLRASSPEASVTGQENIQLPHVLLCFTGPPMMNSFVRLSTL